MAVMEEMVGKWKLKSRDPNFGEFLACREVGWFLRKLMCSSVVDMEYELSQDRATLTKVTSNFRGTTRYVMPTEGEFCPKRTLSGKPEVGRIFETSGGNMVQEMRFADSGDVAATIKHRVVDLNRLEVDMQCKDIKCQSVYVRQ